MQLLKDKFLPNENLESIIKQQKQRELKFGQKRENTQRWQSGGGIERMDLSIKAKLSHLYLFEEAAVSHIIEKADQIPKYQVESKNYKMIDNQQNKPDYSSQMTGDNSQNISISKNYLSTKNKIEIQKSNQQVLEKLTDYYPEPNEEQLLKIKQNLLEPSFFNNGLTSSTRNKNEMNIYNDRNLALTENQQKSIHDLSKQQISTSFINTNSKNQNSQINIQKHSQFLKKVEIKQEFQVRRNTVNCRISNNQTIEEYQSPQEKKQSTQYIQNSNQALNRMQIKNQEYKLIMENEQRLKTNPSSNKRNGSKLSLTISQGYGINLKQHTKEDINLTFNLNEQLSLNNQSEQNLNISNSKEITNHLQFNNRQVSFKSDLDLSLEKQNIKITEQDNMTNQIGRNSANLKRPNTSKIQNKSVSQKQLSQKQLSQKKRVQQFEDATLTDSVVDKQSIKQIQPDVLEYAKGNNFIETNNDKLKKFMDKIQGHLTQTNARIDMKKQIVGKIFGMMKKSKNIYIKTLLDGEQQGHCQGILKRFDPYAKQIEMQQEQRRQRYLLEQQKVVQEKKKIRDQQILLEKKKRIQDRLDYIQNLQSNNYTKNSNSCKSKQKNQQTKNNQGNNILIQQTNSQYNKNIDLIDEINDGIQTQSGQFNLDKLNQMISNNKINEIQEDHNDNIKIEQTNQKQQERKNNSKQLVPLVNLQKEANYISVAQPSSLTVESRLSTLSIQLGKQYKQKIDSINSKISDICLFTGIKKLSTDKKQYYEQQIFKLQNQGQFSSFAKVLKHVKYLKANNAFQKNGAINVKEYSTIIQNSDQIGLTEQKQFQEFFQTISEGSVIKNCELKRQSLKDLLEARYFKTMADKIIFFLEDSFQTLNRLTMKRYCDVLLEILNGGPDLYKKMMFSCLSFQNPGKICEHDLFYLFETFKQKESFYFYNDLINRKNVPRDFNQVTDDSDQIFFTTFSEDLKNISRQIDLRKRLMGMSEGDKDKLIDESDNFKNNSEGKQDYEDSLLNHIEFIVNIISNSSGMFQAKYDVFDALIENDNSLFKLRNTLIDIVAKNGILQMKDSQNDQKSQCLGVQFNKQSGKRISTCIHLNWNDFNRLIKFKKGQVSSFMQDLMLTLTGNMISLKDFELFLGHVREADLNLLQDNKEIQTQQVGFQGKKSVLDYLDSKTNYDENGMKIFKDMHKIDFPYFIQNNETNTGRFLISNKHIYLNQSEQKNIKEKNQRKQNQSTDNSIDEYSMTQQIESTERQESKINSDEDRNYNKNTVIQKRNYIIQTEVFPVGEDQISELTNYKQLFGAPNFYRLFKIFYYLCQIPKDAQNNPFLIFIDRKSIQKNFFKVFGEKNDEIALRFYNLFVPNDIIQQQKNDLVMDDPLSSMDERIRQLDNKYQIRVIQFFKTVSQICFENNKSNNFIKLAFRFFDYDNNGYIGSVDIINLKNCFNQNIMQQLQQEMIEKDKISPQTNNITDIQNNQNYLNSQINQQNSPTLIPQKNQIEKQSENQNLIQQLQNKNELQSKDFYLYLMIEVQLIRDFYVKNLTSQKNKNEKVNEYFNPKVYEYEFLNQFNQKFNIRKPTLINYLKSKLLYEKEITKVQYNEKYMDKMVVFQGFEQNSNMPTTDEIVETMKILYALTSSY